RLTAAGDVFYEQSLEVLGQINNARALLRGKHKTALTTIDFAVPHTLSLTYMPRWMTALESGFGQISTRLIALNVHDAVMTLVEGGCDLLLCYHHPLQPLQLDPSRYDMITLGRESLRAYSRCDKLAVPKFLLPGSSAAPLPFLSYTNTAYFGRMVEVILGNAKIPLHLDSCYETDMAEGLKMMALEGRGVAFLPESAVVRELKDKRLARADGSSGSGSGSGNWEVEMEIRLYRERPSELHPGKPLVARMWEYLMRRNQTEMPLKPRRKPA
ncbi:MAG: LysR substrate-binding domain-containing protein, partial [bacterium]